MMYFVTFLSHVEHLNYTSETISGAPILAFLANEIHNACQLIHRDGAMLSEGDVILKIKGVLQVGNMPCKQMY